MELLQVDRGAGSIFHLLATDLRPPREKLSDEGAVEHLGERVVRAYLDALQGALKGCSPGLISDALAGDSTLFARQDEVEAAWAIVDPVLGTPETTVNEYAPGSWGPKIADNLIDSVCRWHDPGADAHSWTRACDK